MGGFYYLKKNWLSVLDCSPGFFPDVLKYLEEKIKCNEIDEHFALIIDSIYIKSVIRKFNNETHGYIDYGGLILNEDQSVI